MSQSVDPKYQITVSSVILEWSSDHLSVPSEAQHEYGKRVVEAASYDHLTAERAVTELSSRDARLSNQLREASRLLVAEDPI